MNNTAIKVNPISENKLASVPAINQNSRLKKNASRIHRVLVGFVTPKFDYEAWRRLEFKNEFTHESRHEPPQWRI